MISCRRILKSEVNTKYNLQDSCSNSLDHLPKALLADQSHETLQNKLVDRSSPNLLVKDERRPVQSLGENHFGIE